MTDIDLRAVIQIVTEADSPPVPAAAALGLIATAVRGHDGETNPAALANFLGCPKGQAESILHHGERLGLVVRGSTLTEKGRARVTFHFAFPTTGSTEAEPAESPDRRAARALASLKSDTAS